MSPKTFSRRLVFMGVLLGLAGCDSGESAQQPSTGGAGIPGVRGPASPKMKNLEGEAPPPGAAGKKAGAG
jgi:hypothetical protein